MQSRAPTLSVKPALLPSCDQSVRRLVHASPSSDQQEQTGSSETETRPTIGKAAKHGSAPPCHQAPLQRSQQPPRFRPVTDASPTSDQRPTKSVSKGPAAAAVRKRQLRKNLQVAIPIGCFTDDTEADAGQRSHMLMASLTAEQIASQYPPELARQIQPLLLRPMFLTPPPADLLQAQLSLCPTPPAPSAAPTLLQATLLHPSPPLRHNSY